MRQSSKESTCPSKFYEITKNLIGGFFMFNSSNPYIIQTENRNGNI